MTNVTVKQSSPNRHDDAWGFAPGTQLVAGRTVLKLLGGGRRYEAYLAFDETLLSNVVVKVLRPSRVEDPIALAGLDDEYRMVRDLNHPCICRAFDAQLAGDRPHIVLEHLEGPRLSSLLRKFGRVDIEQLTELGVQLAAAVHYLHGRDVVHLDIKPQNTIMGAPPRLIDLSVAHTVEQASRLTTQVGTDAYMAPEQCAPGGAHPVGTASDIWGLGVTLYEAATGRLPYPRGSDAQPYPQLELTTAPRPADVPVVVADVIQACLAPVPRDRPHAREVSEALQAMVGPLPKRIILGRLRPRW